MYITKNIFVVHKLQVQHSGREISIVYMYFLHGDVGHKYIENAWLWAEECGYFRAHMHSFVYVRGDFKIMGRITQGKIAYFAVRFSYRVVLCYFNSRRLLYLYTIILAANFPFKYSGRNWITWKYISRARQIQLVRQ